MNDEELRKLAMAVVERKVFGSWMLGPNEPPNTLGLVFMPLLLGARLPPNVGAVYEYYSEAGPRSINGYPTFFSCRVLTKTDTKNIQPYIDKLAQQRKEFLADGN